MDPYDADSEASNSPNIGDIQMSEEDEWDVCATGLLNGTSPLSSATSNESQRDFFLTVILKVDDAVFL